MTAHHTTLWYLTQRNMEITKDFLMSEIKRLSAERDQAAAFVTASQGAIDAYQALVERLDAPEETKEK